MVRESGLMVGQRSTPSDYLVCERDKDKGGFKGKSTTSRGLGKTVIINH